MAQARATVRSFLPADRRPVVEAMDEEEGYFLAFDTTGHAKKSPGYAPKYTARLLRRCRRHDGILLVAHVDGQLAGMIAAELVAGRPGFSLDPAHPEVSQRNRVGEVLELYVRKGFRREGVGRALLTEAERRLRDRGCRWMRLEVFAPNLSARRFYASLGYRPRDLRLGKPL